MKIDHVAIVVKNINEVLPTYENFLGFKRISDIIHDPIQKVNVLFLQNEKNERLELIEPSDPSSPSMNALKKGGGVNHVCYQCNNLNNIISEAKKHNIKMVCEPVPGAGLDNHKITFFVHPHLGLVEFVEI